MYVIGTEYVGLGISAAVEVRTGFQLLQVNQQVEMALRVYLWPVLPAGASQQVDGRSGARRRSPEPEAP